MDALVVLGAALALGSPLALAPWATAGLVVLALIGLLRARRYVLVALALAALLIANVRARHALSDYEATRARLAEAFQSPRACHGEGIVVRSPSGRNDGGYALELEPTMLECGVPMPDSPRIALAAPASLELSARRGERLAFEAELAVVTRFVSAELPDPRPRAAARAVHLSGKAVFLERRAASRTLGGFVDGQRERVRWRVRAFFSARAAPMAEALLLGDRMLDAEDERAFAASGLSHLLAVSGMHLVLAVATIARAARALLVRTPWAARTDVRRLAAWLAALLALAYADFAGGSGSAWRAAVTMALVSLATATDRVMSPLRALGASVLLMAAWDPFVLHDLSFSLSVLATLGLITLGEPCTRLLERCALPKPIRALLGPTVAASLACLPLLARIAPEVPTLALLLNLVAIPLSESCALPLCLGFAVLPEMDVLARGVALAAGNSLELTLQVARIGSILPRVALPPPTPLQLAVLSAAALCWPALQAGRRQRLRVLITTVCALLGAEWIHRQQSQPRGGVRITQLDIGQGDSALIDLPDGSAMLVDSGGTIGGIDVGERVLSPLLRARRRDRLRLVVVTHPHPDHYGGLATGAAQVQVDTIWDTLEANAESPPGSSPVAAMQRAWWTWREDRRRAGTALRTPAEFCGAHVVGGAHVEVLMPCPSLDPEVGANDNSIVLRLGFGGRSALFVGDAEHHEERALLAGGALRADLLKIGHHGSRTSTSADFLQAVAPSLALVSAGARNKFGHPHPQTLATLQDAHVPLARTDRMGELRVEWDEGTLWVDAAGLSPQTGAAQYWLPRAPPRSEPRR